MTATNQQKRIKWVDALRALAIVLVVFEHTYTEWTPALAFTDTVKMPLFFCITGYLFNRKKTAAVFFRKNILEGLIIPYFFLSLLPLKLLYGAVILRTSSDLLRYLNEFINGKYFWYMPCIVLAEIVHFTLCKAGENKRVMLSLVLFLTGLAVTELELVPKGNIPVLALIAQGYLLIGEEYRDHEEWFDSLKSSTLFCMWCAFLIMGEISVFFFHGCSIGIHTSVYFCYPLNMAMIVTGCLVLMATFSRFEKYPKIWLFIGANTLAIYCLHGTILANMNSIFSLIGIKNPDGLLWCLIKAAANCFLCCIAAAVLNRVFPVATGKWESRGK